MSDQSQRGIEGVNAACTALSPLPFGHWVARRQWGMIFTTANKIKGKAKYC